MVCPRCIMAVEDILAQLNIEALDIRLGEVILTNTLDTEQIQILREKLSNIGFELLDNDQQKMIEQIKTIIISQVQTEGSNNQNISEILVQKLHRDYSSISKLFSTTEGITIEHFVILQKIEKVKELLTYDQLTISEIADILRYSSVAHLSAQFKKVTGLTPSLFKTQGGGLRKGLDSI